MNGEFSVCSKVSSKVGHTSVSATMTYYVRIYLFWIHRILNLLQKLVRLIHRRMLPMILMKFIVFQVEQVLFKYFFLLSKQLKVLYLTLFRDTVTIESLYLHKFQSLDTTSLTNNKERQNDKFLANIIISKIVEKNH